VLLLVRDEFGNLKGLREDKHIRLAVRCPVCTRGVRSATSRGCARTSTSASRCVALCAHLGFRLPVGEQQSVRFPDPSASGERVD
jgi:hypothetical protein